jgi:positive regulator of sigma E activity
VQYDAGAFPWLGTVVGGYIFGLGIVYAGGCATGTWYRAALGGVGGFLLARGLSPRLAVRETWQPTILSVGLPPDELRVETLSSEAR